MKKIAILISTYNGEKYLYQQLDSIAKSKGNGIIFTIDVYIRDDGSKDKTIQIINEFNSLNITLYCEKNIGPSSSFILLSKKINLIYDFYMFCDQDDIWCESKIIDALIALDNMPTEIPVLYYCGLEIVNKNLDTIGIYNKNIFESNNLVYTLKFGSLIPGCTMGWNKKLMKIFQKVAPYRYGMHDSLLHLICLIYDGKVICDNKLNIKYRQHENNAVGMKKKSILKKIYKTFKRRKTYSKSYKLLNASLNENQKKDDLLNAFAFYDGNIQYMKKILKIKSEKIKFSQNLKFILKVLIHWF